MGFLLFLPDKESGSRYSTAGLIFHAMPIIKGVADVPGFSADLLHRVFAEHVRLTTTHL